MTIRLPWFLETTIATKARLKAIMKKAHAPDRIEKLSCGSLFSTENTTIEYTYLSGETMQLAAYLST